MKLHLKNRVLLFLALFVLLVTPLVEASQLFMVKGDSMNPTLQDGDIIEVLEGEEWQDSDMVVAELQDGTKVIKRLVGDKLVGDNHGNTAIYNVNDVTILGKAKLADDFQQGDNADLEKVLASSTLQIKDVPVGSIVVDNSWQWEHKTGNAYTGSGEIKPIEWIVVANNHFKQTHYGNTGIEDHITLLSNETIAKYHFDISDSVNTQAPWGTRQIRHFLRTTLYNTTNSNFRNTLVLTQTKTGAGSSTSSQTVENENFFLLSVTELIGSNPFGSGDDGVRIPFFPNDNNPTNVRSTDNVYWSRTPADITTFPYNSVYRENSSGQLSSANGNGNNHFGVRPAVNLKANTSVQSTGTTKTNSAGQTVTVYEIVYNQPPTLTLTSPTNNQTLSAVSGFDTMTISGQVNDPDVGDILTLQYRFNNTGTWTALGTTITATGSNQAFSRTLNVGSLAEGTHSIQIRVSDDKGALSSEVSRTFNIDKTTPNAFTPTATVNSTTQITISGSTTDPTSNGVTAGMHATPYNFRQGTNAYTGWQSGTSRAFTGLTANTIYTFNMLARDATGNERTSTSVSRWTLANNATSLTVTGRQSDRMTFTLTNGTYGTLPQHQVIVVQAGENFDHSSRQTDNWSTATSNRTVNGLANNQAYDVWVQTRNGDSVTNTPVRLLTNIYSNRIPTVSVSSPTNNLILSEVNGRRVLTISGTVQDLDNDPVTISATIGGRSKTTVITNTSTSRPWSLTWDVHSSADNIAEGTYSNFVFSADDGKGGTASANYTGTITVDKTKPTIQANPTEYLAFGLDELDITVTLNDNLAGINDRVYQVTNSEEPPETWIEGTVATSNSFNVKLETQGDWHLHVLAKDYAGNEQISSFGVYRLLTEIPPPVGWEDDQELEAISLPNDFDPDNMDGKIVDFEGKKAIVVGRYIQLTATNIEHATHYAISLDGYGYSEWKPLTGGEMAESLWVNTPGLYPVHLKLRHNEYNVNSDPFVRNFLVDWIAPETFSETKIKGQTATTSGSLTVKATGADNLSPILYNAGSGWQWFTSGQDVTITGIPLNNQRHDVKVRFSDLNGNVVETVHKVWGISN